MKVVSLRFLFTGHASSLLAGIRRAQASDADLAEVIGKSQPQVMHRQSIWIASRLRSQVDSGAITLTCFAQYVTLLAPTHCRPTDFLSAKHLLAVPGKTKPALRLLH